MSLRKSLAFVLAAFTLGGVLCSAAHGEGLAGTYQICRTKADELDSNTGRRAVRIRIDEQAGKYAVAFKFEANDPWRPAPGGPYEAAPASQFKEIIGVPYLSRESGAVPDGVRPSKDVPLKTLIVKDAAVMFFLMPAGWFQRNKEMSVSYDSNVVAVFAPRYGGTAKPMLLCRI